MERKIRNLRIAAWSLCAAVCAAAITAWVQDYNYDGQPLIPNTYELFPLLGLLAFSIMWTHYVMGAGRELAGIPPGTLKQYLRYTGYVVLALLCLHPGLLIVSRFKDGYGLPPGSYESYVAPGLGWITLLGTASLLVFLAFEFHRKYGERSWWRYVADASDFAMLAIIYHGLRLGSNLQQDWFRSLWWFYAAVLVAVLIRKYYKRLKDKKPGTNDRAF